jgi:hypothetical protein
MLATKRESFRSLRTQFLCTPSDRKPVARLINGSLIFIFISLAFAFLSFLRRSGIFLSFLARGHIMGQIL